MRRNRPKLKDKGFSGPRHSQKQKSASNRLWDRYKPMSDENMRVGVMALHEDLDSISGGQSDLAQRTQLINLLFQKNYLLHYKSNKDNYIRAVGERSHIVITWNNETKSFVLGFIG